MDYPNSKLYGQAQAAMAAPLPRYEGNGCAVSDQPRQRSTSELATECNDRAQELANRLATLGSCLTGQGPQKDGGMAPSPIAINDRLQAAIVSISTAHTFVSMLASHLGFEV